MKKWERNCSKCNCKIYHKNKQSRNSSHIKNRTCYKCRKTRNKITEPIEGWIKNCPKCNRIQKYSSKDFLRISIKKNTLCYSCSVKGRRYSNEVHQKISKSLIGNKRALGYKHSEETKKKHRIKNLKRYEKLGIGICVDEGSKEWFYNYNKNHNSNFKPKKFIKLGYVADGYDKNKHIWIEYDTPYHNRLNQKKKDLVRQNNIIKYFENIGDPLKKFVRILTWENYKEKIIYENKFYNSIV